MINLFQAITDSVREDTSTQYPLSPVFYKAANLFKEAHVYWWAFKDYRMFTQNAERRERDITHGNPAVYGAALHFLSNHSTSIQYIVTTLLIAKCAEDLLQHHIEVYKAYQDLRHAIKFKYPIYEKNEWDKRSNQLLKIIRCAGRVLQTLFKLGMCLRDVYLLSKSDQLAHYRACTEMFANLDVYHRQIKENYTFMLNEVEKRQDLINRIMGKVGSNVQSTHFISTIRGKIEELAQQTAKNVVDATEELVEPFYNGKVTAIQLDFEEEAIDPLMPATVRYPPWNGQHMTQITPKMEERESNDLASQLVNAVVPSLDSISQLVKSFFGDGGEAQGSGKLKGPNNV